MESFFVHFPKVSEAIVRQWLTRHTTQSLNSRWVYDEALYCSVSDDYGDWTGDELSELRSAVATPFAYVQVDVSGRAGATMVRKLAMELLEAIPDSLAQDDFIAHLWTHHEISTGVLIEGRQFYDLSS